MSPIRLIGIGSPFGDDRVGWHAVEAIERSGMLAGFPAGMATACRCSQPVTDLLPMMSGARAVFLIDGMKSGAPPGTVRRIEDGELPDGLGNVSSHGLGVADSLALARTLGMLPRTLTIYGIEIGAPAADQEISQAVLAAIPALLREIETDLRRLVEENDSGK